MRIRPISLVDLAMAVTDFFEITEIDVCGCTPCPKIYRQSVDSHTVVRNTRISVPETFHLKFCS